MTLTGTSGGNTLRGGNGNDTIDGRDGWDWLYGGAGNDRIIGGNGNDDLFGGAGADVFDYNAISETPPGGGQRDFIHDFEVGVDKIDLSTIDARAGGSGNQAFIFLGEGTFGSDSAQPRLLKYHYEIDGDGHSNTIIEGTTNRRRESISRSAFSDGTCLPLAISFSDARRLGLWRAVVDPVPQRGWGRAQIAEASSRQGFSRPRSRLRSMASKSISGRG